MTADEPPLVVPVSHGVVDDAFSSGWSVLVRGSARTRTDPDERRRLDGQVRSRPWAGGGCDLWTRVEADTVTGRRIGV